MAEDEEVAPGGAVVGRETELAAVDAFFGGASAGRDGCLVLIGDPGIGKTTLWEAAMDMARQAGHRILSSRCSQSEANLSFASLLDLLDGLDPSDWDSIPVPQRNALEVAMGLRVPTAEAGEPLNVAAGFLSLIRRVGSVQPVLIAVDDIQWLDSASGECLTFAARRLRELPVKFVVTRHPVPTTSIERELKLVGVRSIEVGGLSFGAIRSILSERIGATLPRRAVRRISDESRGNPLLALELGRIFIESDIRAPGATLPVPDLVEEIFGVRARQLSPPLRRVLLAVSLSGGLNFDELADAIDPLVVDDAVSAGYLTVDRTRLRPSHPMLSAIIRKESTAAERRELHLALAEAVADPTLRTRHLALAAAHPDPDLAEQVSEASGVALQRGDIPVALELADHALRLTPADDPAYPDRLIALARCRMMDSDLKGVAEVLGSRIEEIPHGRQRVQAHLLLGEGATAAGEAEHLDLALAEAADDLAMQAVILARRTILLLLNRVERVREADQLAVRALEADRAGRSADDPNIDPRVANALAWSRVLSGRPVDDLAQRVDPAASDLIHYGAVVDRARGVGLAFRGEIAEAHAAFEDLRKLADQRGEVRFSLVLAIQLCELYLRSGLVLPAQACLEEIGEWMAIEHAHPVESRLKAMCAAVQGDAPQARAFAVDPMSRPDPEYSPIWDWLEANRALGLVDLLEEKPAAEHLGAVWDYTTREHIDDPGAFPVAGELVLARVQCGDLDGAREVLGRLEELSRAQSHPWGLATTKRSAATLALADRYDPSAAEAMDDAAAWYTDLGLEFEAARTLMTLGGFQRRNQKKADARRSLVRATEIFDRIGATGWSAVTRSEMARVSGRRGQADRLTASERQVVDLAVAGLSNKEIAARLFVSVYTVEAHLTHSYAKLGVRSRSQLAARLEDLS